MVKLEYGIVDIVWPFYLFFMVVRPRVLWTYVQRVYARTSLGGKDVRPEGAWTYVHRTFERAWTGMNETCVDCTDSEHFLNENECICCYSCLAANAILWDTKKPWSHEPRFSLCGRWGIRTPDPLLVRQTLWTNWAKRPIACLRVQRYNIFLNPPNIQAIFNFN